MDEQIDNSENHKDIHDYHDYQLNKLIIVFQINCLTN
jgi:hypothetical protein